MGLTFDGVKEGGRDVPLTDSNKEEFVELLTQQVLIKSREPALAAVKTGFLSGVAELAPRAAEILQTLSATDLMLLMHGGEAVSSELVRRRRPPPRPSSWCTSVASMTVLVRARAG